MQGTFQAVAGMPFEAEDRMVGRPSPLLGIVADLGSLLLAVNGEDGSIQIQDGVPAQVSAPVIN